MKSLTDHCLDAQFFANYKANERGRQATEARALLLPMIICLNQLLGDQNAVGWFGGMHGVVGYRFSVEGRYGNVIIETRPDTPEAVYLFRSGCSDPLGRVSTPLTNPELFLRAVADRATLFYAEDMVTA